MNEVETIVDVRSLKKYFPLRSGILNRVCGHVKAVDGVSFGISQGETLGMVGESGCGKSTTGRVILRLMDPTAGSVRFHGKDMADMSRQERRLLHRKMQIVFQDPYASLNPRMTVGGIIGEALTVHNIAHGKAKQRRVEVLLEEVGLSARHMRRYPHEFSGGQRQRVGIARALAVEPEIIICDEPVSALDVSVQAQVINLLEDLQKRHGLTYLFIAHDLAVVRHISHRVGVMYLGRIVEIGNRDAVFADPLHPYTQGLFGSIPIPDPKMRKLKKTILLEGDVPSPSNPPSGCRFHTRCPHVMDICRHTDPEYRSMPNGSTVACHLY